MERAGIWVRVSTTDQSEANQRPDIERYCAAHGYDVARTYELNDRSAFHGEQEAKQQEALADTHSGVITVLVVWASDRLERRGAEATLRIFRLFKEAGGRVESVLEPFLSGDDPDLMLAVTGWKDRAESKRKSDRIKLAQATVAAQGGFWGRVPFGYRSEGSKYGKRLVPDKSTAPLVKEIFERIADGDSTLTVARWLTERTGRAWNPQSVNNIVRNQTYALGLAAGGSGPRSHRCAPLVALGLFKQANLAIDNRPKRGKTAGVPAMLRGAVACASCRGMMYRHYSGSKRKPYYRCRVCGTAARLDAADRVTNEFLAKLTGVDVTERRLIAGSNHDGEIAAVEQQLRDLPTRGLDEDAEDEERARLRAERRRLRALPSEPDEWQEVPTGRTHADIWEATPIAERGKWLVRHGIEVQLTKEHAEIVLVPGGVETLRSKSYPLRRDIAA